MSFPKGEEAAAEREREEEPLAALVRRLERRELLAMWVGFKVGGTRIPASGDSRYQVEPTVPRDRPWLRAGVFTG